MTSDSDRKPDSSSRDPNAPRRLATWQKMLAVLSLVVTVGGLGLMAVGAMGGDSAPPTAAATGDSDVLQKFGGTGSGEVIAAQTAAEDPTFLDEWSPTIFKLGFSFFAAFCVAFALRSFVKIAIIAIGLLLIALFGLQYLGLVEIDWSEISGRYDSVAAWLSAQTSSFKTFIQGALPSSGSAAVGFIAGFRRR